jgi:hypothetical protein
LVYLLSFSLCFSFFSYFTFVHILIFELFITGIITGMSFAPRQRRRLEKHDFIDRIGALLRAKVFYRPAHLLHAS